MTRTAPAPHDAPLPRRAFWRSFWQSPPVTLGIWTVIALLLGMASARAEAPAEAPKTRYAALTRTLPDMDHAEFTAVLSERQPLRMETVEDIARPHETSMGRTYLDATLSESFFREQVQPLLAMAGREVVGSEDLYHPLVCTDDGLCRQSVRDATVELRFVEEKGGARLVSVRVARVYYDEGC
jgi:hypothetical protein